MPAQDRAPAPEPQGPAAGAHQSESGPVVAVGEGGAAGPGSPALAVTVFGTPVGQGNLRHNQAGYAYHANGAELRAWRERIQLAVMRTTGRHLGVGDTPDCLFCRRPRASHALLLGAVQLDALVVVPALKTVKRAHPTTRSASDWDHYGRAISDALTGLAYLDDSQIVDGRVRKAYPSPGSLPEPGARIRVWEVTS